MFLALLYVIAALLLAAWLLKEISMGMCLNSRSMAGKTVLITGGSDGIGYETVLELVKRGARVIVGCRRFKSVIERIRVAVPDANIESFYLDLGSKQSVVEFVESVKSTCDKIHVLVNNAGVGGSNSAPDDEKFNRFLTTDKQHELVMGTNYYGHVVLNNMLMDLVKRGGEEDGFARIILVSSLLMLLSTLDDSLDLDGKNMSKHDNKQQYNNSKQAQFLYCRKLSKIFNDHEANVSISALHPGYVRTEIWECHPSQIRLLLTTLAWLVGKSCWQGAQTTLYLATENGPREAFNGKFFADCRDYTEWVLTKTPDVLVDRLWSQTHKVLSLEE